MKLGGVLTFSREGLQLSDAVRFAEKIGCTVRQAETTADGFTVSVSFDQATANRVAVGEMDGMFQFDPDPPVGSVRS